MSLLRRCAIASVVAAVMAASPAVRADAEAPSQHKSRPRTCCALASHLPLHLGAAHVPVALGIVVSAKSIGPHSYRGDSAGKETNGIVFTRRGGFMNTGHMREFADMTAHLVGILRPLLQRGDGVLNLGPRDGQVHVRVKAQVPEAKLATTSTRLAMRIAFQISVWVEVTQHYGHRVFRGADEYFSAFTPEDLYSNLLGAHLGAAARDSELPYDRAMDKLIAETFAALEATPSSEARRILTALDGRWWRANTPWPWPTIPITHSFDIGPHMHPALPPADIAPPAEPIVLEVPQVDDDDAPLADLYSLEIVPDLRSLPGFKYAGPFPVVTADDLPQLVGMVRRAIEAGDVAPGSLLSDGEMQSGPLAHYLIGLRLLDWRVAGGVARSPSESPKGVFGGSLVAIRGDTRAGDFALMRFDVAHTAPRGLIAGFTFFRSDALFFCHDKETDALRPPLISLLGPCARGEWLGIGGSIGEAFHDGRTGRTALRPIAAYGVLDVLGNGQSPSYDGLRLLLRGGGAVEHVWTAAEGGVTIPRVGGNAFFLVRSPGSSFEATALAGYRTDATSLHDAAFESSMAFRWYFLLGGDRKPRVPDGANPWGVGSLGLEGGYSFWTRPQHSIAESAAPFVSADHSGTWQLLVTTTLGFEGLTF